MGNGQVHVLDTLFLAKLKGLAGQRKVGRTAFCVQDGYLLQACGANAGAQRL